MKATIAGFIVLAAACQRSRPPAADCNAVADTLVSLELGNYATREARVAALPVKRALCEKQRITALEAACLAKVIDTWTASSCVPRLYPEVEGGDCAAVTAKMRAMVAAVAPGDPSQAAMIDKALGVVQTSCVEDRWPDALRRCVLGAKDGDVQALGTCESVTPPALRAKLQQRMMAISR